MVADYDVNFYKYDKMYKYYIGEQDIMQKLTAQPNKCNDPVVNNYIKKFITEEVNYAMGNPISYVSKQSNESIINAITKSLYHWKYNHNADIMRDLEIYGKVYLLNYIDAKGRFCERILNPKNAIEYCDDDGVVQRFIHFYKKKYDTARWHDVYYPDGTVMVYRDNVLKDTQKQLFNGIPVSICQFENVYDTIFYKIKTLQDAYNLVMSTQCCTIADYRNAYLVFKGGTLSEEGRQALKENDLINLPEGASAEWLIKQLDSNTIESTLNELKYAMYVVCNHIDGNADLPSNTSGVALRSRLVFLEQISQSVYRLVEDAMYDRLERLFDYLKVKKNVEFDVTDIVINNTPNIPQDLQSTVQIITQLNDVISHETKLKLLPFIENPQEEIDKIQAEDNNNAQFDISKLAAVMQNSSSDIDE